MIPSAETGTGTGRLLRFMMIAAAAVLSILFLSLSSHAGQDGTGDVMLSMTLQDAAGIYSTNPRDLASILGIAEPVSKKIPMGELGIFEADLDELAHIMSAHDEDSRIFLIYIIAAFLGALYLLYLENSTIDKGGFRQGKRFIYIAVLLAVLFSGFILGKSPNPMQSVSKLLKAFAGIYPDVFDKLIVLGFFAVVSVVINKIICGWACPLGALQELIFSIPVLGRIKKRKVPFWISNGIRIAIFVITIVFLASGTAIRSGRVLYHEVNAFNLFDLQFDEPAILITVVLVLLVSAFLYRPFCSYVCPFGLISWLLEKVSIFRVVIDREKCIDCGKCEDACPTHAAGGYLHDKKIVSDCFSCGRCLDICPTHAIKYGSIFCRQRRKAAQVKRPKP